MPYANSLKTAQYLLEREEYHAAIREISGIFEEGLRDFLGRLERAITTQSEKEYFQQLERKIGKERTYQTFHLSQLTVLLSDKKVWHMAKRQVASNLRMSKNTDWSNVRQWRNDATHNTKRLVWDEMQATQMMIWVKVFLYEFELLDDEFSPKRSHVKEAISQMCPNPDCRNRMRSKWKYCPDCGTARTVQCRHCNCPLEADFKLCPSCGKPTPASGDGPSNESEMQYLLLCKGAWMDGVLNTREKEILEKYALKHGIDESTADRIQRDCAPPANLCYHNFVESVHIDHVITVEERRFLDRKAKELGIDDWVKKEIEDAFQEQHASTIETADE